MENFFAINSLGENKIKNPILKGKNNFSVDDDERVLIPEFTYKKIKKRFEEGITEEDFLANSVEKAGPRQKIFFNPEKVKVAIVTCGGLCPGLNVVIRSIVNLMSYGYNVKKIYGVEYGYHGLANGKKLKELNKREVLNIHKHGGTILGTSRGTPPTKEIVKNLIRHKIDILFTIGGDGTMRGADKISNEIKKQNKKISVVGIPKTIDNDIYFVEQSFGFQTAVKEALVAIASAHEEARSHLNGIGFVKLMGRDAGFIAAESSMASGNVDICLVPEVEFKLNGKGGLLEKINTIIKKKGYLLIVISEGAGQNILESTNKLDPSGNKVFADIGIFLKKEISNYLQKKKIPFSLKYIDPSYIIRSTNANSYDQILCSRMAHNAVHAAMAGKTSLLIGNIKNAIVHIPISLLKDKKKRIQVDSHFWSELTQSTFHFK